MSSGPIEAMKSLQSMVRNALVAADSLSRVEHDAALTLARPEQSTGADPWLGRDEREGARGERALTIESPRAALHEELAQSLAALRTALRRVDVAIGRGTPIPASVSRSTVAIYERLLGLASATESRALPLLLRTTRRVLASAQPLRGELQAARNATTLLACDKCP